MGVSLHQFAVALVSLMVPALALAAPADTIGSAVLPGGVEALRRSLGDRAAMAPATVVVELTRRFYGATEAASERDPAFARFQAWLRDTTPLVDGSADVRGDLVPLPAPLEFWRESGLEHAGQNDIVRAVLRTRSAAFLYMALLSMDADTRAWLVDRPRLVGRWSEVDRGALLVAAPYLRVVSGRCELPGGPDLAAVWADLTGVEAGAAEACVEAVLRAHSGHLPFLLEIVATLSAAQQRAAFQQGPLKPDTTTSATPDASTAKPDTSATLTAARALLAAVRQVSGAWHPGQRPFARPSPDTALLLAQIGVDDDGGLALPGGRRFWEFVLEDDDLRVAEHAARAAWSEAQPVTAAWLVGRLASTPIDRQVDVYHQVLFAARLLADEPASEAAAVAAAIRAHQTFAPLMRVLERLEVADAATLARVARQADALTRAGQDWQSRARLVQWQALLALLDRFAHHGVLSAAERTAAIDALTVPVTASAPPPWRGWLTAIVPGLPAAGDLASRPVERALLARLAASPVTARPVEWEGTSYVLDLSAAEHDRLARVRARDSRPLLDAAVRVDAWLGASGPRPAGDALQLLTAIAAGAGLDRPIEPDDEFGRVARDGVARARRQLVGAAGGAVPPGVPVLFGEVAAAVAALALTEFAYAANMGWAEDLPLTAAGASRRHVFVRTQGPRRQRFWSTPAVNAERRLPWHVSGSLLGLDVALAPVALRRLSRRPPAEMPLLNTGDRVTLVATAAVLSPRRFGDEARDTVTGFVRDALDRIENVRDRSAIRRLAGLAGLSTQRAAAAEWLVVHDRSALSGFFAMTELVRLGAAGAPARDLPDAWGNYELPLSGRSDAGRFPDLPVERYGGRARRLLAVALPELQVTLAVRLAELKLPATLVPAVMASATLDVVNTTPSRFADDWQAVVDRVRAIDVRAVERYLALLTTAGPLRRQPASRR
jgi:hypothetical protein